MTKTRKPTTRMAPVTTDLARVAGGGLASIPLGNGLFDPRDKAPGFHSAAGQEG